jgi:hypothetical protein
VFSISVTTQIALHIFILRSNTEFLLNMISVIHISLHENVYPKYEYFSDIRKLRKGMQ